MNDETRDHLTAAGQRIVLADVLRQDALTEVRALLDGGGADVSIADAARLTALAEPELRRLLGEAPG